MYGNIQHNTSLSGLSIKMRTVRTFFPKIQQEITFIIGTSKEENDKVIDLGNPGDIWFHARNHPSCHVIAILSDLTEPIDKKEKRNIMKIGAGLVKRNTIALRSVKEIEIIYTDIQHVKKTKYLGCVHIEDISTKSLCI